MVMIRLHMVRSTHASKKRLPPVIHQPTSFPLRDTPHPGNQATAMPGQCRALFVFFMSNQEIQPVFRIAERIKRADRPLERTMSIGGGRFYGQNASRRNPGIFCHFRAQIPIFIFHRIAPGSIKNQRRKFK
jgi:hypothetical protein